MLDKIQPEHILFLDIETIPQREKLEDFPEKLQQLWRKKAESLSRDGETAEELFKRAGIYAEFGKIICISCGTIFRRGTSRVFRVKSFYGDDEKELLTSFLAVLEKFTANPAHRLCAHNGQEFDFPYIARRILINGLKLPTILDIAGAKPWEVKDYLLDTMQLWKFGDYKHYTSLDLLCNIFGIPTPKDDIEGSQVAAVYYEEKDLDRIARYCEKDTLAVAQVLLKFKGEALLDSTLMEIV
ncbi:MAG: 3'-5' exonuclease [Marinilabiliales bacterium]|nr:3'-5' exonuclease [Marinilabiliales bacterium]